MEIKYHTIENYTHQRTANLINNSLTCLSVNGAVTAAASCSLATSYQCFNDLGFSYITDLCAYKSVVTS